MSKSRVFVAVSLCLLMALSPIFVRAVSNDEAATTVVGQPNFTTGSASITQTGLDGPTGLTVDSSGDLWVADYNSNRVLEYATPVTTGEAASVVLGQTAFTNNACSNAATGLCEPIALAFDASGNLWVADAENNRVVEFHAPFTTGEAASLVLGQTGFGLSAISDSAVGMDRPYGIAFDSSGNLWVSESGNNRVTEFVEGGGFTTGEAASLVLGQTGFGLNPTGNSATGMDFPAGIAFDSTGNLWVADLYNSRVTEFTTPFTTDEAASIVIGQAGFGTSGAATTATGLSEPSGIVFDASGNLWVAGYTDARVTSYDKGSGFTDGEAASVVFGQSLFTTSTEATGASGMGGPWGLAIGANNLWVGDYADNRVVGFSGFLSPSGAPNPGPVPLPAVIPKHLIFNFNTPNAPTITGNVVGTWGNGVIYNLPGYNATTDINPYDVAFCTLPSGGGISIISFVSVAPSNNATELFVSYYYNTVVSAQGFPTEPACAS
jgi:sugar lactone lactonase YvrE